MDVNTSQPKKSICNSQHQDTAKSVMRNGEKEIQNSKTHKHPRTKLCPFPPGLGPFPCHPHPAVPPAPLPAVGQQWGWCFIVVAALVA